VQKRDGNYVAIYDGRARGEIERRIFDPTVSKIGLRKSLAFRHLETRKISTMTLL